MNPRLAATVMLLENADTKPALSAAAPLLRAQQSNGHMVSRLCHLSDGGGASIVLHRGLTRLRALKQTDIDIHISSMVLPTVKFSPTFMIKAAASSTGGNCAVSRTSYRLPRGRPRCLRASRSTSSCRSAVPGRQQASHETDNLVIGERHVTHQQADQPGQGETHARRRV